MRILWIGAGKVTPHRDRYHAAAAPRFVNAPAERCSVHRGRFGRRFVRYQGGDYTIMGLYYVPRAWKAPRPFFVLRRVDAAGGAAAAVWSGERRRWGRAHVLRVVTSGAIIAVLLGLPAWMASRPHASTPPAAHRVTPFARW